MGYRPEHLELHRVHTKTITHLTDAGTPGPMTDLRPARPAIWPAERWCM